MGRSAQGAGSDRSSVPSGPGTAVLVGGALLLAAALGASGTLAFEQITGIRVPGCGGADSPCGRAAASPWGRIALGPVHWPLSYVGSAYFAALLCAWLAGRGALSGALRWVVRAGVGVSVLLTGVLVAHDFVCRWCLAAHVANAGFWLLSELAAPRRAAAPRAASAALAAFAGVTAVLAAGHSLAYLRMQQGEERELARWIEQVGAREQAAQPAATRPGAAEPQPAPDTAAPATAPADAPSPATAPVAAGAAADAADPAAPRGFAGRYVYGPRRAPIRIVMFTDYQCPDCQKVESELREILRQRDDVSLSVKHFPFCRDCNPYVPRTLHPNACWAARAAEAAGMLGGDEGFYRMHFWLFDRRGVFRNNAELAAGLHELGFDPQEFIPVMTGPETLRRVQADIEEAVDLGIRFTPMIFINGRQLKGWRAPRALTRAIEAVAATNPPPLTAEADRPPGALQKYADDWQEQAPRPLPRREPDVAAGPPDAPLRIVVFGDYEEQGTIEVLRAVDAFRRGRSDVRFEFRHYPFDRSCNPFLSEQAPHHPHACLAARAVEAAGELGGPAAWWAMHGWLIDNWQRLSPGAIRAAADALGLDADRFARAMNAPEVLGRIALDLRVFRQLGFSGIPAVLVNERPLLQTRIRGRLVLDALLGELESRIRAGPGPS